MLKEHFSLSQLFPAAAVDVEVIAIQDSSKSLVIVQILSGYKVKARPGGTNDHLLV